MLPFSTGRPIRRDYAAVASAGSRPLSALSDLLMLIAEYAAVDLPADLAWH
jgi:hypothetical protein